MKQQKDPDPTKGKSLVDMDSLSIKDYISQMLRVGNMIMFYVHLCKQIKPFM